jgi:hypothetical protein
MVFFPCKGCIERSLFEGQSRRARTQHRQPLILYGIYVFQAPNQKSTRVLLVRWLKPLGVPSVESPLGRAQEAPKPRQGPPGVTPSKNRDRRRFWSPFLLPIGNIQTLKSVRPSFLRRGIHAKPSARAAPRTRRRSTTAARGPTRAAARKPTPPKNAAHAGRPAGRRRALLGPPAPAAILSEPSLRASAAGSAAASPAPCPSPAPAAAP